MSIWNKPATTNVLLGAIAVLLLGLVIQRTSGPSATAKEPPRMTMGTELPPGHPPIPEMDAPTTQPMGGTKTSAASPMGGDGGFDQTLMVLVAMRCPAEASLTLDSPSCTGTEAERRREAVRAALKKDLSIRGVFDAMVERFGEKSLTDQAIQIRRMRTSG